MTRKLQTACAAVLCASAALLAFGASSAAASDLTLATLGAQSASASAAFVRCTPMLCKVNAMTRFIKLDGQMAAHITTRLQNGSIKYGSACYRANAKVVATPKARTPFATAQRWLNGAASDAQVADAQIHFLTLFTIVAGVC